jgi:hypothetical protein
MSISTIIAQSIVIGGTLAAGVGCALFFCYYGNRTLSFLIKKTLFFISESSRSDRVAEEEIPGFFSRFPGIISS